MARRRDHELYRSLLCAMQDHEDFRQLTPSARLVLYTLRLSQECGRLGLFYVYSQQIADRTGYSVRVVNRALKELAERPSADAPWIYREGALTWIRNSLRHDPRCDLADPGTQVALGVLLTAFPRTRLVRKFAKYYNLTLGKVQITAPQEEDEEEDKEKETRAVSHDTLSRPLEPAPEPPPPAAPEPVAVLTETTARAMKPPSAAKPRVSAHDQLEALARATGKTVDELRAGAALLARSTGGMVPRVAARSPPATVV